MALAVQTPSFYAKSEDSYATVPPPYRRREPEKTALHEIVRENLEPFLQYTRENYKNPLPKYVEKELRRYLTCGMLCEGFTRIRCPDCGKDMIVAFSCGSRTVCPSCAGRRMVASAMHLVDKVLPDCPLRQWVLSAPYSVRRLLSSDNRVFGAVLRIFVLVMETFYLKRARDQGIENAKTGMLTIMQRFGGSLNANPHIHTVTIDGVYTLDEQTGLPRFHFQPAPTPAEMQSVAQAVRDRVLKMLRRKGLIQEETHESNEEQKVHDALEGCRKVALSRGRFERIDDKGRAQQDLFPDELPFARRKKSPWAADIDGFSVEAGVHFDALDRKGRERLIRYCLRPAISNERLLILSDGSIAYKTKYPMRRSKTHRCRCYTSTILKSLLISGRERRRRGQQGGWCHGKQGQEKRKIFRTTDGRRRCLRRGEWNAEFIAEVWYPDRYARELAYSVSEKGQVKTKPVKAKTVEGGGGKASGKAKKRVARIYTPSQRAEALAMLEEKGPVETSRTLGISRFSLYEWKRRHEASKQDSTVSSPIAGPNVNKAAQRDDRILKEWKAHPGLGPSQIRNQLRRNSFKVSVRTVRMVMEENGYVTPKTRRVEVHNQRYESVRPNHLWHMDFVQRYIHKQRISVLFLIDDFSRFIPGFAMWDADRSEAVIECFESAVSRHGRPETVMSDAGAAFWAWNGVSRFTRLLEELGTDQIVARVPQVNGKVEVLNGNVQKELFDKERFCNLAQAHAHLESWVSFYNFHRTHQALGGLLVPADRYFGRAREILAHIEAGRSPEGIGEPIRVGDRQLDLLRVSSQGGKVEVLLMGERIWPQATIP